MAGSKKISADVALGLISDEEGNSSSSETGKVNIRDQGRNSSEDDFSEDEDEQENTINRSSGKRSRFDAFDEQDSDSGDDEEEEDEENSKAKKLETTDAYEREAFNDLIAESKSLKKLKSKIKKLTPEQLAKHEKKIAKTGVIYISKIPPYMKPAKMRQVLSRFGEIDRLFLKPEDIKTYHRRVKYGGNKKRSYIEGWAEFVNKKDAKLCAFTLNGNNLGGKKGSFYYDDVMNIKYIKGFKWTDLTEQITKENEIRQAKLQAELSQASKLNKTFVANVERSKMIANIQKKRKQNSEKSEGEPAEADGIEIRRTFVQRGVSSKRADAPDHIKLKQSNNEKLDNVLSSIF